MEFGNFKVDSPLQINYVRYPITMVHTAHWVYDDGTSFTSSTLKQYVRITQKYQRYINVQEFVFRREMLCVSESIVTASLDGDSVSRGLVEYLFEHIPSVRRPFLGPALYDYRAYASLPHDTIYGLVSVVPHTLLVVALHTLPQRVSFPAEFDHLK